MVTWVSSRSGEILPEREDSSEDKPRVETVHPPFLVYKQRLYVLAKKAPRLDHFQSSIDEIFGDRRAPGGAQSPRGSTVARTASHPGNAKNVRRARPVVRPSSTRAPLARRRPYIKGIYRVYSSRVPHLAPTARRKRAQRR